MNDFLKTFIKKSLNKFGVGIKKTSKPEKVSKIFSKTSLPEEVVYNIFQFFENVPIFYDNSTEKALKIAGQWRALLKLHRTNQIHFIENKSFAEYKELQESMFFNELIFGLGNYHYYNDVGRYLSSDFIDSVNRFEYVTGMPLSSIATPEIYSTWGLERDGKIIKCTDPWHGMQAYNITNILLSEFKKERGSPPVVVDLGSGFGGMAEKLVKLYSKPIDIYLVDIPLNLVTAYAFLSKQFSDSCFLIPDKDELSKLKANPEQKTRFIFLPTIFIPQIKDLEIAILHNSCSFSEMDYVTIEYYLKYLCHENTHFLIESNSNKPVDKKVGSGFSHKEIPSSRFPIPKSHSLLSRYLLESTPSWERYLTSIYKNILR